MFNVYVLYSRKDGKTYTGSTNNLADRLNKHKNGKVRSTKYRLPIELIYTEALDTLATARKKEMFYKTSQGRRNLKKLIEPIIKELLKS